MPHLLLDLNLIIVLILVAHDELCFLLLLRLGFVHIRFGIRLSGRGLEKAQLDFLKVLEGCLKEVYDVVSRKQLSDDVFK